MASEAVNGERPAPCCPPGVSPRKWATWNPGQRAAALLAYWRALPFETRQMLALKYAGG